MKAKLPVLVIAGAGLVALIAIAVIPVPKPRPDFTQATDSGASAVKADSGHGYNLTAREITWSVLIPQDWEPLKDLTDLRQDLGKLSDADPRAAVLLKRMREFWDYAPAVAAMDGTSVRIAGYVVPLEASSTSQAEFLLVPYFGACIHTPPPPANQVIHVVSGPITLRLHTMDTVWVSGLMVVAHADSEMGASSYRMKAFAVDSYVPQR